MLKVIVNTDHNITGGPALSQRVGTALEKRLARFSERLTRIEVHLDDEHGAKHGPKEFRCMMEARPAGMEPLVVTHQAANVDESVDLASRKLERLLDHTFGKLSDRR